MIDIVNSAVQEVAANAGVVFGTPRIKTGCTVGEIDVGISVDGDVIEGTEAAYTPAAVDEYGNVTVAALVKVYGCGCGANVGVAIVNTSDAAINVRDANLIIDRRCGGDAA